MKKEDSSIFPVIAFSLWPIEVAEENFSIMNHGQIWATYKQPYLFERCYMGKSTFMTISAVLMISFLAGCSSQMDNTRFQGQAGYNTGIGLTYDRGREDYPGQSYANGIGTDVSRNTGMNGSTGQSGNEGSGNTPGGTVGITGTQLATQESLPAGGGITLHNITTPVRRGGTGGISFQGKADTQYTITAVYKKSEGFVTSTAVKRAGYDGVVDLTWKVGQDTVPGTYGIMIAGGGEQLSVSYTVTD